MYCRDELRLWGRMVLSIPAIMPFCYIPVFIAVYIFLISALWAQKASRRGHLLKNSFSPRRQSGKYLVSFLLNLVLS